jgi:SAM-dependent methyltransferase
MCILELGCGAGRVTRTLAKVFGEVHALDVSGEMVDQAREAVRDLPNAFIYQNNGVDLSVPGDRLFDFAYSGCVFHHIGERKIIENYVREVHRLLRPGCLFKFEVQGCVKVKENPEETWLGAPFSEEQAVRMAVRCGFDPRYRWGGGEDRFWLWFFKWP